MLGMCDAADPASDEELGILDRFVADPPPPADAPPSSEPAAVVVSVKRRPFAAPERLKIWGMRARLREEVPEPSGGCMDW